MTIDPSFFPRYFDEGSIKSPAGASYHFSALSIAGTSTYAVPPTKNEDRFVVHGSIAGVFDGATPVIKETFNGLGAAEFASDQLRKFVVQETNPKSARELLLTLNLALRKSLLQINSSTILEAPHLGPSAAGALIVFHSDHTISYASAADCVILAKQRGTWIELTRDTVAQASQSLFGSKPFDEGEWRETLYNKYFAVLNGDLLLNNKPELPQHGIISLREVSEILMLSDGTAALHDQSNGTYLSAAKDLETLDFDLSAFYEEHASLVESDPERKRYPRLKHRDDFTALLIRIAKL